jgi:hypothetical protein
MFSANSMSAPNTLTTVTERDFGIEIHRRIHLLEQNRPIPFWEVRRHCNLTISPDGYHAITWKNRLICTINPAREILWEPENSESPCTTQEPNEPQENPF